MKPYYETDLGKLYHGDCLEIIPHLEPVDLVLCDLPYGKTQNKWDSIIDIDLLWAQYNRLIKDRSTVVLTAMQPFASRLVSSNYKLFKWEDIWLKTRSTGHLNCNVMPLRQHENILIFGRGRVKYNPQIYRKPPEDIRPFSIRTNSDCYGEYQADHKRTIEQYEAYPRSVVKFNTPFHERNSGLHPTQKPIGLFSYLIETYSDKENTVLDNCIGSGTTAIACERLDRRWIGIEIDEKYCEIAAKRIETERKQLKLW